MIKIRSIALGVLMIFAAALIFYGHAGAEVSSGNSQSLAASETNHNIISVAGVTVDQAKAWARDKGATETFINLADVYFKYCVECGQVNPAIAYAQSAKETNFGKFTGVIDESYNNPCGLKNSNGGSNSDASAHMKFATWDDGVKAQLDHLALYAGADGYPKAATTDPRHFDAVKGTASTVHDLGGKWAPSTTYGDEINAYYNEMITKYSSKKLIVIDPGHNYGGDLGATSKIDGVEYKETEINMQVAENLKAELENRGYNVILTRESWQQPKEELSESLKNRVRIANNANAALFISIHQNSASNEEASGIETYYSSAEQGDEFKGGMAANKITDSKKIAENITNKVASGISINNRGAKDSEFYIKSTNMPSVLIECGFLTNKEDALRCSNVEKQKFMCKLISDAVVEDIK